MSIISVRPRSIFLTAATGILALSLHPARWGSAEKAQGPAVDIQAIVDQFYPTSMVADAEAEAEGQVPLSRVSAFVVFDQFSDGAPKTIIAAYSNGSSGAIRVIRGDANRVYSAAFEPQDLGLSGTNCAATLVDVEPDGVNEIMISFTSYRGPTSDWIFRWNGSQLTNLGPTRTAPDGVQYSSLSDSSLVDLTHSGSHSLVTLTGSGSQGSESPNPGAMIYKLQNGSFVAENSLLFISPFVHDGGEPQNVVKNFLVPPAAIGPFLLQVINGERDGSQRVGFLRIKLNGAEILSPSQFSQQVEFLGFSVNLNQTNTIEVTLAETPPGQVWITIQGVGTPSIAGTVTAQGRDAEGNFFVDLQLQNTGNGHARDLEIDAIALNLLSGTGEVGLNRTLSPVLPHTIGALDAGASVTRRFYINMSSTVTRFSIKEAGPFKNLLGADMVFITEQEVIP